MQAIESASAKIFGTYGNEDPAKGAIHKIIKAEEVDQIHNGLNSVLETFDFAIQDPANKHRWGASDIRKIGYDALNMAGISDYGLARMCASHLDPEWVLKAEPEEVIAMAGLVVAARKTARQFHTLAITVMDAD